MRTKIRLTLNIGLQLLLVLGLLFQITNSPQNTLQHIGWFALFISIWQIIHAVYVVQKYKDWHHHIYLKNITAIGHVAFWILIGSGILWSLVGNFFPSILVVIQYLAISLGVIVSILAFRYFVRSLVYTYQYANRPRSFWDL